MRFSDIPGQEKIKNELISMYKNEKIPHALIFTGPEGNGKFALAMAFASFIQCKGEKDNDKCGKCIACKKTDKFIHPDINFTFPTFGKIKNSNNSVTSKVKINEWREMISDKIDIDPIEWNKHAGFEGKSTKIYAESINELLDYYRFKRFEGNKKISIIWKAELWGNEGNKMLKLIEEPPPDSILILVVDDIKQMLATIISRCHIVRIPVFSNQDLKEWATKKNYSNNNIDEMAIISEGNILEFEKLLNQDGNEYFEKFLDWLRKCYKGDTVEINKATNDFDKLPKYNQEFFFKYSLRFLEKTLRSYYLEENFLNSSKKETEAIYKIKPLLNLQKITEMVDILNKSILQLKGNANRKALFFNISIQFHTILRNHSV